MRVKANLALVIAILLLALTAPGLAAGPGGPGLSADEALKMLKDGNARYMEGKPTHPRQDAARRALTPARGSTPSPRCSPAPIPGRRWR